MTQFNDASMQSSRFKILDTCYVMCRYVSSLACFYLCIQALLYSRLKKYEKSQASKSNRTFPTGDSKSLSWKPYRVLVPATTSKTRKRKILDEIVPTVNLKKFVIIFKLLIATDLPVLIYWNDTVWRFCFISS